MLNKKVHPNYLYMKLQFTLTPEVEGEDGPNGMAPVLVTNLVTGYTWQAPLTYAVFLIMSGFKNVEKNERVFRHDSGDKLFTNAPVESFEGFFPLDQIDRR